MADLNELLDQATEQALGLSQQAELALSAVDEVLGHARGVAERAGAEGASARAGLAALGERLDEIEDDVLEQANEAKAKLDALQAEVGEARGELQGVFSRMQELLESSRAEQQRLAESFDADSDAVVAAVNEAVAAMRELEAEAVEQVGSIESAVDDFRAQLERLRDEVTAKLAEVTEQAAHFVAEMEAAAERASAVADEAVTKGREQVDEMREQVPALVNDAATVIGQKYGQEAVARLQQLLPELEDRLNAFSQEAETTLNELEEHRGKMLDHANGIRNFLDHVEQVAQAAQVLA